MAVKADFFFHVKVNKHSLRKVLTGHAYVRTHKRKCSTRVTQTRVTTDTFIIYGRICTIFITHDGSACGPVHVSVYLYSLLYVTLSLLFPLSKSDALCRVFVKCKVACICPFRIVVRALVMAGAGEALGRPLKARNDFFCKINKM